jgi:hypothetical protein
MWKPRRLTTLWASTACYWGSFTFFLYHAENSCVHRTERQVFKTIQRATFFSWTRCALRGTYAKSTSQGIGTCSDYKGIWPLFLQRVLHNCNPWLAWADNESRSVLLRNINGCFNVFPTCCVGSTTALLREILTWSLNCMCRDTWGQRMVLHSHFLWNVKVHHTVLHWSVHRRSVSCTTKYSLVDTFISSCFNRFLHDSARPVFVWDSLREYSFDTLRVWTCHAGQQWKQYVQYERVLSRVHNTSTCTSIMDNGNWLN